MDRKRKSVSKKKPPIKSLVSLDKLSSEVYRPPVKFLRAKQRVEKQFLRDVFKEAFSAQAGTDKYGFENIVGVGISEKLTNNSYTGQMAITVYVVAKVPKRELDPKALVPEQIDGVPTDIVATGEFRSFPHRGRYRLAPGGVSVGHFQITAGTLGCLVRKGNNFYILSNNHVLANVNNASLGDAIIQPGAFDGGSVPNDIVANLSQFIPIKFGDQVNKVDAAIAQVKPNQVTSLSKCFGNFSNNPDAAYMFQVVKKCGRSTQLTRGLVTDVNATLRVSYGSSGTALFQDQVIITGLPGFPFSQPGDSGSLILSQFGNRPVGLLFAGSSFYTVANKIQNVLTALGISIVT